MQTYEKIETLWERDISGTKKLMPRHWRDATVAVLSDLLWVWTEKIDGTNIRVCWDGHTITFGGRTERASIPAPLVNRLKELFGTPEAEELFEQLFGEREVILFGEGYGAKIQGAGGNYIPDGVDFILFDLWINGNYQTRTDVERCARSFGIKAVPIVGSGTLLEAEEFVKERPLSRVAANPDFVMEGLVCRPPVELRDRCGHRVIVKIKSQDYKEA